MNELRKYDQRSVPTSKVACRCQILGSHHGQLLSRHALFKDEIPAVTEDSKERPEREPKHAEHTLIYNKSAGIG